MRLLLWYWGRRGGGAQFTLGLAEALSRRGDVALALSVSEQGELAAAFRGIGVPIDLVPTYRDRLGFVASLPAIPLRAQRLLRQAREFGAEVVVSGMTHLWTPLVAPVLRRAGIAFVPVVHDAQPHPGDPATLWSWRLGQELAAARAAVTLSESVADGVRARRPGLPLLRLALPALLRGGLPAEGGRDSDKVTFLFFGRIRAYKGLDLLRDAFDRLRRTHPTARLRVVGEGDAEACAPGLASLPGVTVEPRWVTEEEVPALVGAADVVVLPYREASQSGVAPIATALGVPLVATPVGGLSEQIRPEETGLMAATPDAAALAEAMARLMDPVERARLAAGAAAAGRLMTDWDGTASALVEGLRPLLTDTKPRRPSDR